MRMRRTRSAQPVRDTDAQRDRRRAARRPPSAAPTSRTTHDAQRSPDFAGQVGRRPRKWDAPRRLDPRSTSQIASDIRRAAKIIIDTGLDAVAVGMAAMKMPILDVLLARAGAPPRKAVEALGAWNGRGTFDTEGTWLTASDHQTCLAAADALRAPAARGFPPQGETHGAAGDGDEGNPDDNGRADGEAPGAAADGRMDVTLNVDRHDQSPGTHLPMAPMTRAARMAAAAGAARQGAEDAAPGPRADGPGDGCGGAGRLAIGRMVLAVKRQALRVQCEPVQLGQGTSARTMPLLERRAMFLQV